MSGLDKDLEPRLIYRECTYKTRVPPAMLRRSGLSASRHCRHVEELGAGEQLQEVAEFLSMGDAQPGKSASIKSIPDSTQSSVGCCLSSSLICLSSSFSHLSLSGSRRQLSNFFSEAFGYDKNKQKPELNELGTALLLEVEQVAVEGFHFGRSVERQFEHHPTNPASQRSRLVCESCGQVVVVTRAMRSVVAPAPATTQRP